MCFYGANNLPCMNGGNPVGRSGRCRCNCTEGYTGDNCEITLNICRYGFGNKYCQNGGHPIGLPGNC